MLTDKSSSSYGYLMPLREQRFKGLADLLSRRIKPDFITLATAGFNLANEYNKLHCKGFAYGDINQGNIFFDPITGEVRICDNDNVVVTGSESQPATIGFMAPELVTRSARSSIQTDLYSLSVLLFYMLIIHHPLHGKKESDIHAFDLAAKNKLYGSEATFIYDPDDDSNHPVKGIHDNAIIFWNIYPTFLRDLFTQAFTIGIKNPDHGRVMDTVWRSTMIRLRDSVFYCSCKAQNFYDSHALAKNNGNPGKCWHCHQQLSLPFRIKFNNNSIVMLNHHTLIYPHHVNSRKLYDFSRPIGDVVRNSNNPNIWGLKNVSGEKWVVTSADGMIKDVENDKTLPLTANVKINFGGEEGIIRY